MNSAAYLHNLTNDSKIVRRDLPQASPVAGLTAMSVAAEFAALDSRALASALSLEFLAELAAASPQDPELIASADGAIGAMLLTVPYGVSGETAAIYDALLATLPTATQLTCLVNAGDRQSLDTMVANHGRTATTTVVEAPDHVNFSVWAQDAYAVSKTSDGRTFFLEPLSFLRQADAVVSDYVATATPLENFQTPLYFQGGNILVGDDFWLIGVDYPIKTLGYINDVIVPNQGETAAQFVKRLYTEHLDVRRRLLYVGATVPVPTEQVILTEENGTYYVDQAFAGNHPGTKQPLFHIDMFLTLAGRGADDRYRILVGDPSLAPPPPDASAGAYAMQDVYDNIAANLSRAGFDVVRNPLPLAYRKVSLPIEVFNKPEYPDLHAIYERLRQAGLTQVTYRKFYFATANNALVQNTPGDERVWLPTYGHGSDYAYLQDSDLANEQVWRSLGYSVTKLPSFHALAQGLGAVHCIQKYLMRA